MVEYGPYQPGALLLVLVAGSHQGEVGQVEGRDRDGQRVVRVVSGVGVDDYRFGHDCHRRPVGGSVDQRLPPAPGAESAVDQQSVNGIRPASLVCGRGASSADMQAISRLSVFPSCG